MKKIIIIGKNSYIGKNVKHYLEKSDEQNLIVKVDAVSGKNEEWRGINFSDYDVVIMCSALVHKKEKKLGWQAYYESNTLLPVEIAEKAKAAGVKQYIFFSSLAIYGRTYEHIDRNTSPKPETYYGQSKYLAEEKLLTMQNAHFRITIIRLPMVYGKHAKGSYRILKKITGICPFFPDISNQKSVISIRNLCRFLKMMLIEEKDGIFHPQDKEYISTANLAKKAAAEEGRNIRLISFWPCLNQKLKEKSGYWHKAFGNLTIDREIDS